jgi:hypothetical protein
MSIKALAELLEFALPIVEARTNELLRAWRLTLEPTCAEAVTLAEEQWCKVRQISAPHHPRVHAWSFDVGVCDAF